MRVRFIAIVTIGSFTFSCSPQSDSTPPIDTAIQDTTSLSRMAIGTAATSMDSTVYIGAAGYFPDTKEFYIPLYYRLESDNYVDPEKLDSIISEKEGNVRKRLPLAEAVKEFYLEEMEHVLLFNSDNEFLGRLSLKRVEYMEDQISSQFVAVYPAIKLAHNPDDLHYAVSANYSPLPKDSFDVEELEDVALDTAVLHGVNLAQSSRCVTNHFKVLPAGNIYSILSNDTVSLLTETIDNHTTVLQEGDDFHFGNIMPLPISVYGKPIILVYYYVPETDVTGNFISAFNGTSYEGASYGRVKLDLLVQNR
jgi:hypothetical protein